MGNVQVRLPDDLEDELDRLADEMHSNRSEALRAALSEGVRAIRLERAVNRYAAGEQSLARAAEHAGSSLQQVAAVAAQRGVPYYRHSVEEAQADVEAVRRALGLDPAD